MAKAELFISCEALRCALAGPAAPPIVIDCSWFMPGTNRSGLAEWRERRIPSAAFLDIDVFSDRGSSLPHMLPREQDFWSNIGRYGVSSWKDPVVLYDSSNFYVASARVRWMLSVFGFRDVRVLAGGLEEWRKNGFPLDLERRSEDTTTIVAPQSVEPSGVFRSEKVVDFDAMKEISQKAVQQGSPVGGHVILDARSSERFRGTQSEPRPGLRSGHIPGSISLPYTQLFPPGGGHFHNKEKLTDIFRSLGVSFEGKDAPAFITTTCGSGVTAAVVSLAVEWCDPVRACALYDGSFSEWGRFDSGAPVLPQ